MSSCFNSAGMYYSLFFENFIAHFERVHLLPSCISFETLRSPSANFLSSFLFGKQPIEFSQCYPHTRAIEPSTGVRAAYQ